RLVTGYFNWIWRHSRSGDTAAQRAGLAARPWSWHDMASYPTLL
ncbi:MAG: IS1 family transposase, partial [Cyanobacteria bacterium P01_A01_bin.116]